MNLNQSEHRATTHEVSIPTKNPITLSIASSPSAENGFKRLAFEEYGARKWIEPHEYPDGLLTDVFDPESDALTILSNGEIVAGTRVVRHSELGFPHERELKLEYLRPEIMPDPEAYYTLINTPRTHWAEVTRVVGKRSARKLTLDIIKCLYWYAQGRNISVYLMVIDLGFFTLCTEHNGIPIIPIGIPVYCEGSWTIPAITEPLKWPELIREENPSGWKYISDESNLDHTWSIQ